MKVEQLELPGMPEIRYPGDKSGKSGKRRWYYLQDAKNERMVSCRTEDGKPEWVPLDLTNPDIMLFNTMAGAREMSEYIGKCHVVRYPYDLDLMRAHWKWEKSKC